MRCLPAWILLPWVSLAGADGGIADRVYHPYVQPLEREIEYRTALVSDADDALDGVQVHWLSYGWALNDRMFAELYAIGRRTPEDSLSVDALEAELRWQLTEQGEYFADWGLLFELEAELDSDVHEFSTDLLVEKEFGRFTGTANLGVIYEWGSDIANEWETALAAQFRYRYQRAFEPALEFYSDEGIKGLGPVALGSLQLGGRRKLYWEAGVIMGLDSDSADRTVRLLFEYEF